MVHEKILFPNPKPVIDVVGESELVMTPDPEIKLQLPIPTSGLFAFMAAVGEEIQRVWLDPAFARVGISFTIIAIVELEAAQGELEIVQAKTFVPKPNPVIEVVGESEFVIVPVPESKVHIPVPTVAVFAVIIVFGLLMQIV